MYQYKGESKTFLYSKENDSQLKITFDGNTLTPTLQVPNSFCLHMIIYYPILHQKVNIEVMIALWLEVASVEHWCRKILNPFSQRNSFNKLIQASVISRIRIGCLDFKTMVTMQSEAAASKISVEYESLKDIAGFQPKIHEIFQTFTLHSPSFDRSMIFLMTR